MYEEKYSAVAMPLVAIAHYSNQVKSPTILQYYSNFIEEQSQLPDIEEGTIKTYKSRLRNLVCYLKYENLFDIRPDQVDLRFAKSFHFWMKSKKKFTDQYTAKNIQLLIRILENAIINGDIKSNPLDTFKVKYDRRSKIISLELDELELLESHKFKQTRLVQVRDLYVFVCYTGFSYQDLKRFNPEKEIKLDLDEKEYIHYKRFKTNEDAFIPLLANAKMILEKYNGKLPVISNQKYNSYLKEIAAIVGIEKELTTHTARKTFGMLMHNEFDVPIETISRMLGHDSVRTTQQWYVKTNRKKVMRDMKHVDFFFNGAA